MDRLMVEALTAELDAGRAVALITILRAQGSTPRKVGSQMLVSAAGLLAGTIGGGLLEARALQAAAEALVSRRSWAEEFAMTADAAADAGMACGGWTEFFIQHIAPDQ